MGCGVLWCVCVYGLIDKLFYRNELCKADLCWDLASYIRWLQIYCTKCWNDTSCCCCCCNILDVSSGLNFFILLCSFSFHIWPPNAFQFQFLQLLEQKTRFYSGMSHPKKIMFQVLYASKCVQTAFSLFKWYIFGNWAGWLCWETLWLLGFIYWVSHNRCSKLYECNVWTMIIKLTYSNTPLMLEKGKCLFQDTLYWAAIYLVKVTLYFKQMAWRITHVYHSIYLIEENNFFFKFPGCKAEIFM